MFIPINIKVENFTVNKVVKYFILADLLFLSGWGLIYPILAIFVVQKIAGGTIFVVGAALFIYWVARAIIQLPVGIFLDRREGEKDDFYVLILSLILGGFASLSFLAVKSVIGLFAVVLLEGLAFSLYAPSWSAIFSRHLDQKHYALDWSLDNAAGSLSLAFASFIGGMLANFFGFEAIFIGGGILSFLAAAILLLVPNLVLPRGTTRRLFTKEKPPMIAKMEKPA